MVHSHAITIYGTEKKSRNEKNATEGQQELTNNIAYITANAECKPYKGPVKLIEWVKIALFLLFHVTSKLFQ